MSQELDLPQSAQPPEASARPDNSGAKILLVDDQPKNLLALTAMLEPLGQEVVQASSGKEALRHLLREEFALVLLDVQMPVLDGVQATARIRALPAPRNRVTIIALTAHAMRGAREEYLAAGMNDYLAKPLDPATLLGKLSDIASALADEMTARRSNPLEVIAKSA